jgi:pyrroline-5-carboxylate reductase
MKLGFIGVGKMGSALLSGILRAGRIREDEVWVRDPVPAAVEAARGAWPKVGVAVSNREIFERCETVLLCVKPGEARPTLEEAAPASEDRLLVSIAAGISLEQLETWSGNRHRVVRVMPNSPAMIGSGATAFALGRRATRGAETSDDAVVEALFRCVGEAVEIREEQLDAVTGLSGSGPAYVYLVIEALADGGVLEGLPRSLALKLAAQTVLGAAGMVLRTGEHPAVLREQVTSPGGTTIAGLATLERGAVRSAFLEAVRSATARSRELRG